jgi:predicted amidophosphoribosyltransferase
MLLPIVGFVRTDRTVISWLDWLKGGGSEIRCPECGWRPEKSSRWTCHPGCFHSWNTFETAGVCPSCTKHWQSTACHKCHIWSPHPAWYEHS